MKKSTTIFSGMALMAGALCLFCTDSIIGAIIGMAMLFLALILLKDEDK